MELLPIECINEDVENVQVTEPASASPTRGGIIGAKRIHE